MSGDETYLEAFIEKLSTLPHQLRRNLDLLRDLDAGNSLDLRELRKLQRQFILAAEEKVLQLEVVEMDYTSSEKDEGGDNDENDDMNWYGRNYASSVPTLQRPPYCVRTLNADGSTNPDGPVLVPTTRELMDYILQPQVGSGSSSGAVVDNEAVYRQITTLQRGCLQKADEKVVVAHQMFELLDAFVHRLDSDLTSMEQLLQVRWICVCVCVYIRLTKGSTYPCCPCFLTSRRESFKRVRL
jgi:Inhibitor of growth proteins N-terminal histone-binding